jgi:ATP-binding cassette subfamily E protein 1
MKDATGKSEELKYDFELAHLYDREVKNLSGGELQRFATMIVSISKAQVFIFDEPSTYLDVKQRLKSAKLIRSLQTA